MITKCIQKIALLIWGAPQEIGEISSIHARHLDFQKNALKQHERRRDIFERRPRTQAGHNHRVSRLRSQQTYYRWRKEYGGMSRDQLKRLKELETANTRLRRAVSDLTLDRMILTEAARGIPLTGR